MTVVNITHRKHVLADSDKVYHFKDRKIERVEIQPQIKINGMRGDEMMEKEE